MSNLEHTPTPWRRGLYGGVYPVTGGPMIVSGQTKSGYLPNHVENETFIVRAVNSFDTLVSALEQIIDMNVQYAIDRYGDAAEAETMACVTVARAALSQAKSNGGEQQ